MSGRTCYAKGGFAQAICGEIPEPAARSWNTREASGRYWTNKDEGPAASCNGGRVLTGCWCSSTTGRGDNCAKVWADGNTCRARASGDRAHASQQTIKVTARCAVLATAVLVLSELKIELAATSLMETPVLETKRKRGQLAPLSFHYMHLHQQCDALLLMGGIGVEHCSRPNYRIPNYNPWENKKVMPKSFIHGSEVTVSCWKERFESFRANVKTRKETLHCVNGDWFNSLNTKELGHFSCEPCVVVGGDGYAKYDKRNEQELYFFSRLAMRVYTELGSVVETSAAAHKFCLTKDPTRSGGMTLVNQQECPEILAIQLAGNSEIEERTMKLLNEGAPDNNQCLEAVPAGDGVSASVAHKACNKEVVEQTISPMALPSIMWNMHKDADRTSGEDLHSAFSSYCGAHGALASLSFGQIFGGVTTGVKSRCHFAPVIKFGQFVDSAITYDKTSSNWPDWYTILADTPILCADGEALTGFKHQPASNKFRYECSRIGGLGAKYEWFSSQVEVKAFDANRANFIESLMMITVDCGTNGLLSGFHFEFSEGGRWARSAYTCSKAGGAPVVMEPSTLIEPLIQGTEGVFCPTVMEPHTGRFEYENVLTGDVLSFERNGRWCVGSDCSAPLGGGTPVGAVMATHQVVNVSDFDGHFEAKGVPKMEAQGGGDLAKQLKKLKPPKRPAQPKKPSLQRFKATMPQYAEECLNYQDLWKKITETHVNEEKEEVVEDAKLEADPGTEGQELEDYHPCAVAAGAGGIFGRLGGGDGKLAPENILYKDWNDCMQGDINRALLGAKVDFAHAIFDLITGPVHEGIELVCNVIPDVEIAPLGAGIQIEPKSICEELADFIDEMSDLPVDFAHETFNYKLEEEGFNACNPFQVGFARIFCDIHCVRDAVIRGDRTILKNLEKATKISNENMQKMVEWSTEANRVETEYLDKKIDHSLKVTTIYLEHIAQNTAPALLKNTAAETQAMMKELRGYAEAASFSTDGLRRAQGALDDFVASAKLENSNGTERLRAAELFHSKVQQLHDSLLASSGGLKHAQVVGRQVASEVQQLERRLLVQERALGRYRRQQSMAKGSQRSENEALMALDHLWWRMRKHLEGYLEVADAELEQFQASLSLLDSYDRCFASKEELLRSYGLSMKMMRKSHRKLKSSWRELSNLMGEVSASIADGGYFESFVAMEGCGSELAKQTLQQARSAVQGMMFLFERFQAASLSPPDVSTLKQSTKRIRKAYTEATKQCKV